MKQVVISYCGRQIELSCLVEKYTNYLTTQSNDFKMLIIAEQGYLYVPSILVSVYHESRLHHISHGFFFPFLFNINPRKHLCVLWIGRW